MADPAVPVQPLTIHVAGRAFHLVEHMTFEQDLWVMAKVRAADLMQLADLDVKVEDGLFGVGEAVIFRAYTSGQLFLIIAGIMAEDGTEWSPATAEQNAALFAGLTSEEDKTELRAVMVGALFRFFLDGAAYRATFRPRSAGADADATAPPAASPTSENGNPSSDGLPATIGTPMSASSNGPSGKVSPPISNS